MHVLRLFRATLAVGFLAIACAVPASAAEGPTLAFVDTQRLLAQYKEALSSQGELRGKAEAYQRELLRRNDEIQKAQKAGKSASEVEKLTKEAERVLRPKKEAVEALDRRLTERIKGKLQRAIADVARRKGIATVVDRQIVLYGGLDLTDEVLARLNGK